MSQPAHRAGSKKSGELRWQKKVGEKKSFPLSQGKKGSSYSVFVERQREREKLERGRERKNFPIEKEEGKKRRKSERVDFPLSSDFFSDDASLPSTRSCATRFNSNASAEFLMWEIKAGSYIHTTR